MEAVLASPKEQLLACLDDPDVVDSLNRFLDQLPLLAFGAEALNGFIKRGDAITGKMTMLADKGSVLTETLQATQGWPVRVGLFGLMGAMRDPNVQASMGMLIEFSKRYGAKLAANNGGADS